MGSELSSFDLKTLNITQKSIHCMLPSDVLLTLHSHLDLKSFLCYISTNKSLHCLFKNELRPRLCESIIKPLYDLKPKNTKIDHPYKFWKAHIATVWLYYYSLAHHKNVTFSFGDSSSLCRYRVHELTNIMMHIFPHYITNTRHRTKECVNPNYESDSYDEETDTWDWKSVETGGYSTHEKKHYINVFVKPKKPYTRVQQISFIKSEPEVPIPWSAHIISYG